METGLEKYGTFCFNINSLEFVHIESQFTQEEQLVTFLAESEIYESLPK